MATQYLTCVFKLHNPSAWRRRLLDYTFIEYTTALGDLLAWANDNIDYIRRDGLFVNKRSGIEKYTEKSISALLPRPTDADLAGALRDALLANTGMMLASYLELEKSDSQETTGYPTARDPNPEGWPNALQQMATVGASEDDYVLSKDRLTKRVKSAVMPIHFARSRDVRLLSDATGERYFAVLTLAAQRSSTGRPMGATEGNLVDLSTGEVFTYNRKSKVLFPIQLGDNGWQYTKFLLPLIDGTASIKAAKLLRDDANGDGTHDYYLHASFEFECPDRYDHETYLGVDKGILYTLAWGVVDGDGAIIEMGHRDDGLHDLQVSLAKRRQRRQKRGKKVTFRDFQRRQKEAVFHELVNEIIAIAREYKAQIVVEDLNIKYWTRYEQSAWTKIDKIFEYKCKLAGVPWRGGVFAAYSSELCIHCGERVDRPKWGAGRETATCPSCGAVEHADEAASINVARRALYKKSDWKDRGGYRAFHRSFFETAFPQTGK